MKQEIDAGYAELAKYLLDSHKEIPRMLGQLEGTENQWFRKVLLEVQKYNPFYQKIVDEYAFQEAQKVIKHKE